MGLVLCGVATAILLAWLSVGVNLKRACVTQDTPYLDLCPAHAAGNDNPVDTLRSRIAANPGDANAYVQLALADHSQAADRALDAATRLSPNEPNVLMLQAQAALRRQDWAHAIPPLIQLVEYRDTRQAGEILARLIAADGSQRLHPHLRPGTQWLGRVLAYVPQASLSSALPLIAQGLKIGVLDAERVRSYVQQLKAGGAWADAYSLWLALRGGGSQPILFNGSFDEPFNGEGFDWEVGALGPPSRTGAVVERKIGDGRGAVLDLRFTGRALAIPLVRQHLFLGEGSYRLRGDYMARQLRTDQGLAWVLRCTASKAPAETTPPLLDTGGDWRSFSFEFSVPTGGGLVASLPLENYAPLEAARGRPGPIAFDGFMLEKLAP
jgi:hypothetical protein